MSSPLSLIDQKTLALAGVLQSACLVDQVAKKGQVSTAEFDVLVDSLFVFDPESTEAVYQGRQNLRLGLTALRNILEKDSTQYADALRYGLSLIHLQSKFQRNSDMQAIMHNRLLQVFQQSRYAGSTDPSTLKSLAQVYVDTIGSFHHRIQVTGNPDYLSEDQHANEIRTLLLSGIRSAVLWAQLRGSRLELIFNRQRILSSCKTLLRG